MLFAKGTQNVVPLISSFIYHRLFYDPFIQLGRELYSVPNHLLESALYVGEYRSFAAKEAHELLSTL